MKPLGVEEGDPGLRLLKDEVPLQHLTDAQKLRIRFWAWLTDRAEREWLRANGWKERERGWWFLPEWHPKKRAPYSHRGRGSSERNRRMREEYANNPRSQEPYDQNHAANSQRYYIRAVQTPRTRDRLVATTRYKQLERRHLMAMVMAHVCAGTGGLVFSKFGLNWVSVLFFLAATVALCLSLVTWRASFHELEMSYIEERLKYGQGARYRDQAGG